MILHFVSFVCIVFSIDFLCYSLKLFGFYLYSRLVMIALLWSLNCARWLLWLVPAKWSEFMRMLCPDWRMFQFDIIFGKHAIYLHVCSSTTRVHVSHLTWQHQWNLQLQRSFITIFLVLYPRPQQRIAHPSNPDEVLLQTRLCVPVTHSMKRIRTQLVNSR